MKRATLLGAAALAGGFVAGKALEAAGARRLRARPDPAATHDFGRWPGATERSVPTSDGGTIHLVDAGPSDAPPLVLVHGVTLSAATWRYQVEDLSPDHRVIAVDQRGHGRSVPGRDGFALSRLALDLAEVIDALGLPPVTLVGHSMGGMVVQRLAIDDADGFHRRVGAMVLMSTSASVGAGIPLWDATMALVTPTARRSLRWMAKRPARYFPSTDLSYGIARLGLGRDASPTHVEYARAMTAACSPTTVAELTMELTGFDHRRQLAHVAVPAAVIVGTHDRLTPPRHARALVRAIPNAELVVLPGAGHMPMLERRADVAAVLRRTVPAPVH